MFLRIVRLRVKEGQEAAFTSFYQERVIPAMAETDGCLYAGLLAPWRGEGHQSLTIWDSAESAAAYEEKGLYHQLLKEAAPFLSERTEWRIRLATDPMGSRLRFAVASDPLPQAEDLREYDLWGRSLINYLAISRSRSLLNSKESVPACACASKPGGGGRPVSTIIVTAPWASRW